MKIHKNLLIVAFVFVVFSACAQDDRPTFQDYLNSRQQGFNQYQKQKEEDFNAFRKQANEQFAAKMAEAWKLFDIDPPMEDPKLPDPVKPFISDNESTIPSLPVKPSSVIAPLSSEPQRLQTHPIPSIPEFSKSSDNEFTFAFFNTPCKVRLDNSLKFRLASIDEKNVAAVWRQLSDEAGDVLVADCYRLIDEMQLCDWAVVKLFEALGDAWLGKGSNESVLMQMYLLAQTGYKARIGRKGGDLVVYVAINGQVYGLPCFKKEGAVFYNITQKKSDAACYIFDIPFPNERIVSLRLQSIPAFVENMTESKTLTLGVSELSVTMSVNQNLMDFYSTYPHSRWDNYVYAGLAESTKEMLYPALRKAIEGETVQEAADTLLHFMHAAFNYKTDQQQFGYERPFFGDELFFYPYNDCEDRAVLYAILVRDLLGVDVVLLEYPNHISTAICLPGEVKGTYLELDGKRYLLCDPTYIWSHIGQVAEPFRNVQPSVIRVQ